MIKHIFLTFSLLFFSACSVKTPDNQWQYKSAAAFNSYTTNFLSAQDVLANNDLKRATDHAKTSATLIQLAKIHLGVCALDISVGNSNTCAKYKELLPIVKDKQLDAYYSLLTNSLSTQDIKNLPVQYQSFAKHINDKKKAIQSIQNINKATSRFLSYALIKNELSSQTQEKIIQEASFYGYKKIALFWLQELLQNTQTQEEKQKILKKISIMNSN